MRAGTLQHQVEIQRQAGTLDARGDLAQEYSTIATRWASIRPLAGRELEVARQINERTTHEIRLRFDRTLQLTTRDRILYRDAVSGAVTIFGILDVRDPDLAHVEYVVTAIGKAA